MVASAIARNSPAFHLTPRFDTGRMPAELAGPDGTAEGDVHLMDKSGEAYTPPPVKANPFGGSGRSMRETPAEGAAPVPTTEAKELTVDPAQPTTTLQIRLHDGRCLLHFERCTLILPPDSTREHSCTPVYMHAHI